MRRLFHGTPPSSIARSCKIISSVEVEGCNSRGIIVPRGNEDKDEDDDGAGTSISASQSALGPFEDVIGENSARLWKDFPKTLSQESERKQVDDVPGRDTTVSCGGEGGFGDGFGGGDGDGDGGRGGGWQLRCAQSCVGPIHAPPA